MDPSEKKIVASPISFSAAQLWDWIKERLLEEPGLFAWPRLEDDQMAEIDYDIGMMIRNHMEAVKGGDDGEADE